MAQRKCLPLTRRPRQARLLTPASAALITATCIGVWLSGAVARSAGVEGSVQAVATGRGTPVALAAADFDEDGVPDLLSGYDAQGAGVVTLHRGNVDSIYPNTPAARERKRAGHFTAGPFLPSPRVFAIPGAPDFLHAGDFDADGHFDVIAASQRGSAWLLRGKGTGTLARAERIALPGGVTAMAVGDINGPDGLADVAFTIATKQQSQLFVFAGDHGAANAVPEMQPLAGQGTAVALGDFDDDRALDVAVAAGEEILVIHGRTRQSAAATSSLAAPAIERRSLPFAVSSMVAGRFTGDRRTALAVVSNSGEVHVLTIDAPAVENGIAQAASSGWTSRVAAQGLGTGGGRLVRARTTNAAADDLLLVERAGGSLRVLAAAGELPTRALGQAAAVLPMRLDADARDDLVMLRPGDSTPAVAMTLAATSLVVVNTSDSGAGSLRQAILDANATAGDDIITFDIPGPGPHTIVPLTPLPPVFPTSTVTGGPVLIDGTSEPDFAGTPVIEISGAVVGSSGAGLTIATSGVVIRGLVINRFAVGIHLVGLDGPSVTDSFVEGNYIGTDLSGSVDLGNGIGIIAGTGGTDSLVHRTTIGGTVLAARNVIAGNDGDAITAGGGANRILGNLIGTDASGSQRLENAGRGVFIALSSLSQIGGPDPGSRNVISGSGGDAIWFDESGPEFVSNNFIGTDLSGEHAIGNGGHGLRVPDSGVTVTGNVISGNGGHGVLTAGTNASVVLQGNHIGTNSAGTVALGNAGNGVTAAAGEQRVTGNLISGNLGHGLALEGLGSSVQGNRIGTDVTGTLALGNRGDGVRSFVAPNAIGGEAPGAGNIIAFNGGAGVGLVGEFAVGTPILSNAIFANDGLGIDHGVDGVTQNDICDADEGAAGLQNFPVITSVSGSSSSTTIRGQLNTAANASVLLQFFSSASADPSGFGEGATLLGSTTVITDSACNAAFDVTLPATVPPGHVVTATATAASEFGPLTSEFSQAVAFVPVTSEEAIRALVSQVGDLVDQGELNRLAGFVLTLKLQAALFFVEHDRPRVAAQQLRGFVHLVEVLVRVGQLGPSQGQALIDAARAILVGLETS